MCAVSPQNGHDAESSALSEFPWVCFKMLLLYFIPENLQNRAESHCCMIWELEIPSWTKIEENKEEKQIRLSASVSPSPHIQVCIDTFCPFLPPGKEAAAGSGWLPGGQSNQLPAGRHHHAGGAAALDVPPHPPGQAAGKRQPAAAADLQRGSLLWGRARVFPPRCFANRLHDHVFH